MDALFHWFVAIPATSLARILAMAMFLLPFIAAMAAFVGVVFAIEGAHALPPKRPVTYVVGLLVTLYAFVVVGWAVMDLPAGIAFFVRD
jgi:hypothetical protein